MLEARPSANPGVHRRWVLEGLLSPSGAGYVDVVSTSRSVLLLVPRHSPGTCQCGAMPACRERQTPGPGSSFVWVWLGRTQAVPRFHGEFNTEALA